MTWISGLAEVVVVGLAANLLGGFLARLFFKRPGCSPMSFSMKSAASAWLCCPMGYCC
ncbi:MAG TPA: hypothetical protein VGB72_09610 [Acidobacteriota bacterium]